MDDCCLRSFVEWGFATGFRLAEPNERHTCETCGQVYQLVREPSGDTPTHQHYTWQPVTH